MGERSEEGRGGMEGKERGITSAKPSKTRSASERVDSVCFFWC